MALALPICHCAAEQLSRVFRSSGDSCLTSSSLRSITRYVQDVKLLSVGAGSAAMAEFIKQEENGREFHRVIEWVGRGP